MTRKSRTKHLLRSSCFEEQPVQVHDAEMDTPPEEGLSLRSIYKSTKNGPSTDDLYEEGLFFRREWALFLDSMNDQYEKQNADCDDEDATAIQCTTEESDSETVIETTSKVAVIRSTDRCDFRQKVNKDTCRPNTTVPGEKNGEDSQQLFHSFSVRPEDSEDVLETFWVLNEQVKQLYTTLDSVRNLPLSSINGCNDWTRAQLIQ